MSKKPIVIVQGAQFGSEAKGAVALALCDRLNIKYVCRTGSVNAGHSVVMSDGRKVAFQQLPVGSILPERQVILGPGAYVHVDTLVREMNLSGCADRLILDRQCGVHLDEYTSEAAVEARNLRIGATGKGCAEAIIHKIKDRGVGVPLLLRDRWPKDRLPPETADTADLLTEAYRAGRSIMLEGTQGSLLDFHCGPYPYVTSRQTISSAWVAEAGLSPALDYEVVLVVRTYPIRVAGNSGPMPYETTWPKLARRMNSRLREYGYQPIVHEDALNEFERKLDTVTANMRRTMHEDGIALHAATRAIEALSMESRAEVEKLFEITTVTRRLRRVAAIDRDCLRRTVRKEVPAYMVLTFLNYMFPELVHTRELHDEARTWVHNLQEEIGCAIRYVTIGPKTEDMIEFS